MTELLLRGLLLVPSAFFAATWWSVVSGTLDLQKSVEQPMRSNEFIVGVGKAIANPWLHNSALRLYFRKLTVEQAPPPIWRRSELFAWSLWNQYQYAGSIEALMHVAHAKQDRLAEQRLIRMYCTLFPADSYCPVLREHLMGIHEQKPFPSRGMY